MIPKKIHYIWVGFQEKPADVINCINTWKQYLPDYEIVEWGNEALKGIDNKYVHDAFESKKWAFVSDYLRLHALNEQGGIYLDTDVEITQSLDIFLQHDFFMGFEQCYNIHYPGTAVIGATQHNPIIAGFLNTYHNRSFVNSDGSLNLQTNTKSIADFFEKRFNWKIPENGFDGYKKKELDKNSVIYPFYFFCSPVAGFENYSIHHFSGSWGNGYIRRDKFKLGRYTLARFKKADKGCHPDNYNEKNEDYPLKYKEKVVFDFGLSKTIRYALLRQA